MNVRGLIEMLGPEEKVIIEKPAVYRYEKPAGQWMKENEDVLNQKLLPGSVTTQIRMTGKNMTKSFMVIRL